jgi:hypothetical protein
MEQTEITNDFFTRIARFGTFRLGRIQFDESEKGTILEQGAIVQSGLADICNNFYQAVQGVRSDTKLSAEGHADKIKQLGREALKKVDLSYDRTLKTYENNLATLKQKFSFVAPGGDNVSETLREIETRALLLQLDQLKRNDVIQVAIVKKDAIVFRAFINAPEFTNILNPKILESAKRLWMEREYPQEAKLYKDTADVVENLTDSFAECYEGIARLAGLVDDTMRARLQRLAQTAIETAKRGYDPNNFASQI